MNRPDRPTPPRRHWLGTTAGLGAALLLPGPAPAAGLVRRPLRFPADLGAHPDTALEWWYVTGWLSIGVAPAAPSTPPRPTHGFQVTFFRSRTGLSEPHPSRFAAHQILLAHVALTDLGAGRLHHGQRVARAHEGLAGSRTGDTAVQLRDWRLSRRDAGDDAQAASVYRIELPREPGGFGLELTLRTTQPLLLQGEAGWSRKGPRPQQASHYYSQPQLQVQGRLQQDAREHPVHGRAWLDHEWSDSLLDADAVGWDWTGINLHDGSALTAFRLRRADGSTLWAGGSWRLPGGAVRPFGPGDVRLTPGRRWNHAASGAAYPVQWTLETPAGRFELQALLDAQVLDTRASTGTEYWEGLSVLRSPDGRELGLGYLEMTGYAGRLQL
ncbi:putative secreted hydrolase [Sphaerotilus hippei]|uniref:Putative secreted hydrolase n=1 Tax=Sphaerotilus hippei TaxID=744406 RepID=A0A318H151_9BURK|nr:carotenoid 1,2-hydratase [Sphaerotilus hippei]PXW96604.1 putative secreted hydrolase [Sphaerotilus hippei]